MTRSRFQRAAAAVSLGTTALLLACGGGGGGSGGPITVSGTVVDGTGAPVSAANVLLNGDGTTLTTTGVEGKFSYAEVKPPYSLTVKSGPAVFEYRGLTRTAPRIVASTAGESHVVQVSGTVTGPTMPLGPNDSILLGATDGVLAAGDANPNTGKYTVGLRWTQGAFKATDVAALHITGTSTGITAYHQTGKRTDVTLQDGVSLVGVDVALDTAVTTHSTVLSYSLGAYTTMGHGAYGLLDANGARYLWHLHARLPRLLGAGRPALGRHPVHLVRQRACLERPHCRFHRGPGERRVDLDASAEGIGVQPLRHQGRDLHDRAVSGGLDATRSRTTFTVAGRLAGGHSPPRHDR